MDVSESEDVIEDVVSLNLEESHEEAILDAAENNEIEKIAHLLTLNPSLIKVKDNDGYTPLHRACYENHLELVEYLLKNNAPVDAKTEDGWQPLHSACHWNNIECIALLIQYGADINAQTKGEQTPLHLVSTSSLHSPGLQLLLLQPDISPHATNSTGDTAEMVATRMSQYYRFFEIIEPCLNDI